MVTRYQEISQASSWLLEILENSGMSNISGRFYFYTKIGIFHLDIFPVLNL